MANCRACGKEIYFLKTKNGKFIPVNVETLTEVEIDDLKNNNTRLFDFQKHKSHFSDCPKAAEFKKVIKPFEEG